MPTFSCAPYLKEIGRGKQGARSLTYEQAYLLFSAILKDQVSPLELGAVMLALRIKGESLPEICAYLDAAKDFIQNLSAPASGLPVVVLPSYNGARHAPNLLPLFAALLAQRGIPVLVHGLPHFSNRVTTYEIWQQLGWPIVTNQAQMEAAWQLNRPVFMSIEALSPRLAQLLGLREILGVRNATHTLVKMLQPFVSDIRALRIASYTHPEYHLLQTEVFKHTSAHALVLRGTEGEVVANPRRQPEIEWFHQGQCEIILQADKSPLTDIPPLPTERSVQVTATWIDQALRTVQLIPPVIVKQVALTLSVLEKI